MPSRAALKAELSAVDATATGRRWSLAFPTTLESSYEAATGAARLRYTNLTTVIAIVLYDLFLFNDWLILHDRFQAMVVARLFIFTPLLLALLWANNRSQSAALREWSCAFGASLGVLLPMVVMTTSATPDKLLYQSGSLLVMVFALVIQRVRFVQAVISLAIMLAIQLVAVRLSLDPRAFPMIATFYATASVLLAMANYVAERADRRTYILTLRGSLLRDELKAMANRDPLTGLYNRRHLEDVARDLWAHATPQRVAAVLLDIDHFKLFNDSYGHIAGDECLRSVSSCIEIGAHDGLAFRFGGEEMLVLFPGATLGEAIASAEAIRLSLVERAIPHPALGASAVVSASFGVASVLTPEAEMADLVARADQALYAAKRAGRNCVRPIDWRRARPREIVTEARRSA